MRKRLKKLVKFLLPIVFVLIYTCKDDNEAEKSNLNEILSFTFAAQTDSAKIDKANKTIIIPAKYNADLSAIIPEIKISERASITPSSGEKADFSKGTVKYIVTAEDKSTAEWIVTISKADEIIKNLISFSVENQQSITISDTSITVICKPEADLKKIVPIIEVSANTSISPASGSSVDFSQGSVNFILKATDGSEKTIKVYVSRTLYKGNLITAFSIPNEVSNRMTGTKIQLTMPYKSSLTTLTPLIEISEGAKISPELNSTLDFSNGDITYKVTSESGVTRNYTVTVTAPLPLVPFNDPRILYTGRIDKSGTTSYKFSAPGAYIVAKFRGTECEFEMGSETSQNYIEVVVDNIPTRVLVSASKKSYVAAHGLADGEHTILICKDTEGAMGSLFFYGFRCTELLAATVPERKIECYGNSITCGAKMITGDLCDKPDNWNASNKAYASYGAVAARALNARWQLTSVSGIGLIKSCCGMTNTMPTTYDRMFLEKSSPKWDFNSYIPDVVTICLGQNDGTTIVQSAEFKEAYITFVKNLRSKYPSATFMLLTSPMADISLFKATNTCIDGVISRLSTEGISKVYKVELPYNKTSGCGSHPDETEHTEIAKVLETAIREKMGW